MSVSSLAASRRGGVGSGMKGEGRRRGTEKGNAESGAGVIEPSVRTVSLPFKVALNNGDSGRLNVCFVFPVLQQQVHLDAFRVLCLLHVVAENKWCIV